MHPLRNYPLLNLFPSAKKFLKCLKDCVNGESIEKPKIANFNGKKEENQRKITEFLKTHIAKQQLKTT